MTLTDEDKRKADKYWVVEVKGDNNKWYPHDMQMSLTRDVAREDMKCYREIDPHLHFRVRPYRRWA